MLALEIGRNSHMLDFAAATDLGISVSTGVSNSPVAPAELTLALIVASRRNVAIEAERMRQGKWPCTLSHRLRGSTLGIFGLGAIGALVAEGGAGARHEVVLVWGQKNSLESRRRRLRGGKEQGRPVRALGRPVDQCAAAPRDARPRRARRSRADEADGAVRQRVARAELIAPGALLDALKKGRPGYAAMDVYEEEPVTGGNHPYLKMDNVLCTPHLGWAEWENFELYFRECFEQIVRFENGEEFRLGNPTMKPRAKFVGVSVYRVRP